MSGWTSLRTSLHCSAEGNKNREKQTMLVPLYHAWACLCFCAALVLGSFVLVRRRRDHEEESEVDVPPGSLGLLLIGETVQFMAAINSGRGFYSFVESRCLRYGRCFKTNIFGETHVFVSTATSAKMILNNDSGKFSKRYIRSIAQLVGDQSLLCASHQQHRHIRGHLSNFFSTCSLSAFIQQFDELIVKSLLGWEHRGTVVVLDEALKITFKIMCRMLLSLESGRQLEMLQEDVGIVCKAMLAFPLRLPRTRFQRGIQARERLMSALETLITQRRLSGTSHEDCLQHLLSNDDETECKKGPKLTVGETKDNILTMIIAGHDTTASAITWMVKYLGENETILDKLRAEQVCFAKKMSGSLKLEDIGEMSYASKVVKESLRMASVVPWFPRLVLQDSNIEGYRIKRGWNINVDAKSVHFDPMVHDNPFEFNPSRFDDESKLPCSFLGFGAGGRTCLGMNMAKAMMLVFLHRLVTTYKWRVLDPDPTLEKWALFSRLKNGCPVLVTRLAEETTDPLAD
ncbi:abscisic acid 8'-hydroxylase 4 [Rhodamnia argentea]|uniref:Abscisic acid 8'-hydroxylase 4 n=1 Tax=Rhodamnia argentea TaxID=178133 RepID=A0A8B8NXR5_9MYRT|nr:abscisic acid 8'-hydroxylase 4 [Rhodamnia argentea]